MKYKSVVTSIFLMIPFCVITNKSAEIFELVHNYDVDGYDIEAADFNNDNLEDFAVTEWIAGSSYYEVFLSNGDCSFTRMGPVFVSTSEVAQLLTGDFNEDSNEDLLIMNFDDTWLYLGDGTGSFTLDEIFPWSLFNGCIGDVNNDGHLDIAGILETQDSENTIEYDSVLVMLGDGTGMFTNGWSYDKYPHYLYQSCQAAFHGNPSTDSILDLCVPCIDGFLIFEGIGDGSFLNPDYYQAASIYYEMIYSVCGDFDEDGYADIALSSMFTGMSTPSTFVYINQQDGTFEDTGYGYFMGSCNVEKIATADLDLDGHLDLSVEGSIAGYGNGLFNWNENLSNVPGANYVFMDMDLDGDLDLASKSGCICRNTTITQGCEGESPGSMTNPVLDVSPNPFSSSVNIQVSGSSNVSGNLQIFDLSGRLVTEFESISSEGEAVFHWSGVSSLGVELPSGIYTARLRSENTGTTATMLKLE